MIMYRMTGQDIIMHQTVWHWVLFLVFVLAMLMLDLGVFHKKDKEVSVKEASLWTLFWIVLALLFCLGIYLFGHRTQAFDFFTAYLLEKSLSVDNLFVFILIFSYFNIAPRYQHKVLFWGILGALVMRAAFIFAGVALIHRFSWIMYVFGAFLVYTGVHMLFRQKEEEDFNPEKNIVIRAFRKLMPVTDDNPEGRFFVRQGGVLCATTFFLTLLFIEVSDLIFAVDSIPAVLSVTDDTFIVFTSNIFAILGLRSLYFALNGIMGYFLYLKYALAGILSFIGVKMCVNELMRSLGHEPPIHNLVSLGVIIGLLVVAVAASVIVKRRDGKA